MKSFQSFVSALAVKPPQSTAAAGASSRRKDLFSRPVAILLLLFVSVACGLVISCGGNSSAKGASVTPTPPPTPAANTTPPCDTYAAGGTPCVAAHSTTRALFASYNGPLYQVQRTSDNTTLNVGLLKAGDYADIAPQDDFCKGTYCVITLIYDQSSYHNDLKVEGAGGWGTTPDKPAAADALPVQAGGHQVYGLSISAGQGYRNNSTKGVATAGLPEGMYMVTSGTHVNNYCCFDYGNAETSSSDTGNGHMDAINFSTECWFQPCYGAGPWVQGDLENGLFQSNEGFALDSSNTGLTMPFVTAMLKNDGQVHWAIHAGNAQSGQLSSKYDGPEATWITGYSPMNQEGAIVLGTGGDNSNNSIGSFFEGMMTSGYPSDATEAAVQANIVGVGYDTTTSVQGKPVVGSEVSIQLTSSGLTNSYLRHEAADGTQSVVVSQLSTSSQASDLADATWIIRRGFADPNCFSFESRNFPGAFMRHRSFILYAEPYDGSSGNAGDATFCLVTGNSGTGYSFQSKNFPGRYIRQFNGSGFVASDGPNSDWGSPWQWDTTTNYAEDTTFQIVAPLKP